MGFFIPVTRFNLEEVVVLFCMGACLLEDSWGSKIRITSVSNVGISIKSCRILFKMYFLLSPHNESLQ